MNFMRASQNSVNFNQRKASVRDSQQALNFCDFEVFDEFEKRFKEFLKSTPYIEQILQTSKEYRMIIESLNILAVTFLKIHEFLVALQ